MYKYLICFAIFIGNLNCFSQSPQDTINPFSVNLVLLERLTLQVINNQRSAFHVEELKWNKKLNLAALDQAKYMSLTQNLTHEQEEPSKASAKLRVKFYGGSFSLLGENVAMASILKPMRTANTKEITTLYTYQQTADFFVAAWMASELHRKNILDPNFNLTALRMDYNSKTQRIYAAQVFGKL